MVSKLIISFLSDASGNGQVDSPNGTSQDLSSQTGNAHDEEEAITSPRWIGGSSMAGPSIHFASIHLVDQILSLKGIFTNFYD